MTGRIEIVPARSAHVRTVARRMRQADRDEVAASSGSSPIRALTYSLRRSSRAWTVMIDGRAEAIFGVGDLNILAGVGAAWLLGTDEVERNARGFARASVCVRDQLLARYAVLRNFVDDRNALTIRWLGWLGCTFHDAIEVRGHTFRLFELRRPHV